MKVPSVSTAQEIIREAEELNPGPWILHNRVAGECSKKIAERCLYLDPDVAYVLGLLHDIGRRFGEMDLRHIWEGYRFMIDLGYEDSARICLTHSFPYKDIVSYNGENDCSMEESRFIQQYIKESVDTDYDPLIQLCDAISFPDGPHCVEKRLVTVAIKKGFHSYTLDKWRILLDLKTYFDKKTNCDIYKLLTI